MSEQPALQERIFCNRSLKLNSIRAMGFDMDYTLALYNIAAFEGLAFANTLRKLCEKGYPAEILSWTFDEKSMIRGLVIDKKNGNILKMDRHRYVKCAYHGKRALSKDERRILYDMEHVLAYEEPDFALVDTIFALAEADLFSRLVDYKDHCESLEKKDLAHKSYVEIHADIRHALDLSHKDGSIKNEVALHPQKYISADAHLFSILQNIRKQGKKTFLLTNSLWQYTHTVMSFLYSLSPLQKTSDLGWTDFFDVILTGASKPWFFAHKNPLYEVDTGSGLLENFDMDVCPKANFPKVFQGGDVSLIHAHLGTSRGSEILYVGDHIYGDILRSKKGIGWRTMLVVEELEREFYVQKNHPLWGDLMKAGNQNSRFAAQVKHYACLYTSRFTNLRHYKMDAEFSAAADLMPHDLEF